MKRKWICLVLLAAVLLAGCNQAAPGQTNEPTTMSVLEPYMVYLSSNTEAEGLFTTDVETFASLETDAAPSFDYPARIALQIGSKTVEMDYNRTGVNSHTYQEENGLSRCQLNVDNGALTFLTIMDEALLADFVCEDAASFENSAKQLISAYYNEDWSKYSIACSTSMTLYGENYATGHTADGFVTEENDGQEITGYNLEFTRVIDGVATSDKIEVRFTFDTLMISFSKHTFDAVEQIPVDTARVEVSVDDFLNTYVDTAKYTLQDYTLSNPKVIREGDRLYYAVIAEMTLGSKSGAGNIESVVTVLTDLEADVASAAVGTPVRPYQIIEADFPVPPTPVQEEPELPAEWLYSQNEDFEGFVFEGAQPEFAAEKPIDLSGLTQGHLYLYSRKENKSIEVTDKPINGGTAFLVTDERIYFVLEADPKTIRQADLTGRELEPFCTGFTGESIVYLCYYGTNATDGLMIFNDNYKRYMGYQADKGFGKKFSAETLGYTWLGDLYLVYHEEHNAALVHFEQNSETVAQTGTVVFWD